MAVLAVPGPFDFALSTERFRVFGIDRATVWHEGGLHRVVNGREVRIEAAGGGVDVEPFEPGVATLLGLVFDLEPYYGSQQHFFSRVTLDIAIAEARHHHVPLLVSPFSCSSYRGS